jgi:hypothetical protein
MLAPLARGARFDRCRWHRFLGILAMHRQTAAKVPKFQRLSPMLPSVRSTVEFSYRHEAVTAALPRAGCRKCRARSRSYQGRMIDGDARGRTEVSMPRISAHCGSVQDRVICVIGELW